MPKIDPKLTAVVKTAAADLEITRQEAKPIVAAAKKTGSKTPIDDVFKAIGRTKAAIDTGATRYILGHLDQQLSRKDWMAYVSKAASTAGAWGPSDDGAKKVKRLDLPAPVRKIFDAWQKSDSEDKPEVVSFDVASKPAFVMSQYSEFGTSVGLFDAAGKSIPLKEDTVNVKRDRDRIQGIYTAAFADPALKNWRSVVTHTDLGVSINYMNAGDLLEKGKGAPKAAKDAAAKLAKELGRGSAIYRNKKDGSYLVIADSKDASVTKYGLFSKTGGAPKFFSVDA